MVRSALIVGLVGAACVEGGRITDLIIKDMDNENCDRDLENDGSATGNLNQDCNNGDRRKLCIGEGGGWPVTGLQVIKSKKDLNKCPSGWQPAQYTDPANGDLNQSGGGVVETLCLSYWDGWSAITDIKIQSTAACDPGWQLVTSSGSSTNNNINEHGHGRGKHLYLCYLVEKQQCKPAPGDIVGYWSQLHAVSAGDPMGFKAGISAGQTKNFNHATTDSISHSRSKIKNMGATGKVTSKSWSQTLSTVVGNDIGFEYSESFTHTFGRDGYAWIWVTDIDNNCGETLNVRTEDVVVSRSPNDPPCCFPGGHVSMDDASVCLDDKSMLGSVDGVDNAKGCSSASQPTWYRTITPSSNHNLCLDLPGDDYSSNGAPLWLWECNGGESQRWVFDSYQIRFGADESKCIDAGDMSNGKQLFLWDCNGMKQQTWGYDSDAERVYLSGTSTCLDFYGDWQSSGQPLHIWDCNGKSNQEWSIWNVGSKVSSSEIQV